MSSTSKPKLYVDVSHTWGSDLQTGMQKVVRQLCAVWADDAYDCYLVVYQNDSYRVLPRSAFKEILHTYSERNEKVPKRRNILEKLKPLYRKIKSKIPLILRAKILMSYPIQNIRLNLNKVQPIEVSDSLNTEGMNLLILELVFDQKHVNYIKELVTKHDASVTFFSYDLIPINHQQYCAPEFVEMFREYLEISHYSENLWSISNTTRNELQDFVGESQYLRKSTFKWLPPSIYSKCNHSLIDEEQFPAVPYWLFVSSFEPRKNHMGLFAAMRILKERGNLLPKIVFVGGSSWDDDPITKGLQELIREGFNLVKLKNINECCVGKLYGNASLTLYPSHFEGFGLPIIESLSFGVPVVTTEIGSTGELLHLPGTLGFEQGNSHDLALKLESFLRNEELQKNLLNGAGSARQNLGTWEDYAKDLFNFSIKKSENLI